MSLIEQIEKDYITAYKAKDMVTVGVLRFLKTALKNYKVDTLKEPDDNVALDIINKQCKQRLESIDQFSRAGRPELVGKEQAELDVLKEYLPAALDESELAALIAQYITEVEASSMRDMGKVMQLLNASHKGQFDGKIASEKVKAALAAL